MLNWSLWLGLYLGFLWWHVIFFILLSGGLTAQIVLNTKLKSQTHLNLNRNL
jgi:hypothetical protein